MNMNSKTARSGLIGLAMAALVVLGTAVAACEFGGTNTRELEDGVLAPMSAEEVGVMVDGAAILESLNLEELGIELNDASRAALARTFTVRSNTELRLTLGTVFNELVATDLVEQPVAERLVNFYSSAPTTVYELQARISTSVCQLGEEATINTLETAGLNAETFDPLAVDVNLDSLVTGSILGNAEANELGQWLTDARQLNTELGLGDLKVDGELLRAILMLDTTVADCS